VGFGLAVALMALVFADPAAAQSTDPDNPVMLTTNSVKGRLTGNKPTAHYYGFVGGPGQVRVVFDFTPEGGSQGVAGQFLDAYGRPFLNLDPDKRSGITHQDTVHAVVYEEGERLVGTFEVKRRQKLLIKVFTVGGTLSNQPVKYGIRIEGGDPAFGPSDPTIKKPTTDNPPPHNPGVTGIPGNSLSCLPKSGKLRMVMDDGTVQEINLSRIREASIKP
jgi:hypothetical protein